MSGFIHCATYMSKIHVSLYYSQQPKQLHRQTEAAATLCGQMWGKGVWVWEPLLKAIKAIPKETQHLATMFHKNTEDGSRNRSLQFEACMPKFPKGRSPPYKPPKFSLPPGPFKRLAVEVD
jgi:hypothetical protein